MPILPLCRLLVADKLGHLTCALSVKGSGVWGSEIYSSAQAGGVHSRLWRAVYAQQRYLWGVGTLLEGMGEQQGLGSGPGG